VKELTRVAVPPCNGEQWRINFSRVEWEHEVVDGRYRKVDGKPEDNWVWSPQGVIDMHRPETWGILQFSTAKPGTVEARPDPAEPARHLLSRIYYAQQGYRERHGTWAHSLGQLGLSGSASGKLGPPRLETTTNTFEASVTMPGPGGTSERWNIASDARIWKESPLPGK
jgi:hypothetical protein